MLQAPLILGSISFISACKNDSSVDPQPVDASFETNNHSFASGISYPPMHDSSIIDGYLDKQSYFPGETAILFVSAVQSMRQQSINVYDLNSKIIFAISFEKVGKQPVNPDDPSSNGYGYKSGISTVLPADLPSGVFLIGNKIPLVVKSKAENVDFTIVYPSNTENAYSASGGKSLYTSPTPATQVSFLRPITMHYFCIGIFKWLLGQTYNYNVISDMDLDEATSLKGKLLLIVGHNEYWTKIARNNFDAYVANGNRALILSGNSMYWHVRYNADRTIMVCYKSVKGDPTPNLLDKTYYWNTISQNHPVAQSIGVDPDHGGYGTQSSYKFPNFGGLKIIDINSPLFKTVNLKRGDVLNMDTHEYDGVPVTGFDKNGYPVLDSKKLSFYKVKLLAFDKALDYNIPNQLNVAAAIIFKKTKTSGTIINFGSTNFCTNESFYTQSNAAIFRQITKNAIDGLLVDENMFLWS